jgi:nucleoside phosphorylase
MAVRAHLTEPRAVLVEGVVADVGRFEVGSGHLTVAVVETGAGSIDAALTVQRAEMGLRPRHVIMTGIAGGLKDVAIGDVVASSKVYWVEGGKEVPHVLPRPNQARVDSDLVQLARTVVADERWLARADRVGGGDWSAAGRRPAALVGPIAVAERVLADNAGRTATLIRDAYGDALCVDMEDFGALSGAASRGRALLIAIRGVSDLLHDKTNTDAAGAQPLAAANAAAFLFELLTLDAQLRTAAHPQ